MNSHPLTDAVNPPAVSLSGASGFSVSGCFMNRKDRK